jgi:hypothetical protein
MNLSHAIDVSTYSWSRAKGLFAGVVCEQRHGQACRKLTIVDKLHESRGRADADANLLVLEQSDLFLDFHVLCELIKEREEGQYSKD